MNVQITLRILLKTILHTKRHFLKTFGSICWVHVHEFLIIYSQNTLFMLELSRDYVVHDNMQMKSRIFYHLI